MRARTHSQVVSTATSVFILPMLVVVIFLYQGFATYYFIITIFGVIVMLFGSYIRTYVFVGV